MTKTLFLSFFLALVLFAPGAKAQQVPQSTADMQLTFSPLVKRSVPAVVNIYAQRVVRERMRVISPFANDPFFGQFFAFTQGSGPVQERIENSLGSGVIVDATGLVATNTHVVKDASEITVVMSDGHELSAQKILVDEKTDLAVLKIDPKDKYLTALQLADSDALEVGDLVLAIGNPFGVGQTVTSGIISAVGRTVAGPRDIGSFIQTDAAINPGNSGGALIDMQGRLIGINSMIFSRDGGSLGIGFAIPSNLVRAVINSAQKGGGKLIRPWTGISGQPVTPDMVQSLGLETARGALINNIVPDSPAARAGLRPGDVILSVDGRPVNDPQDVRYRLQTKEINTTATLEVMRGGRQMTVELTTELPPEKPKRDETIITGANPLAGATVVNISPAVSEEIGPFARDSGVVVIKSGQGAGARLGLRSGDIILSVNGAATATVKDLINRLDRNKSRRWLLEIQRGQSVLNLSVVN
jgi:serine protease Do